ncbi:MAG: PASTA domain-containing protein, partial [Propionibacteriaceae bacterium]|nr:PASTA domain-containing protein [Propionibacteriaceae bacterium]
TLGDGTTGLGLNGAETGTGTLPAVEEPRKSRAGLWWTFAIIALLGIGLLLAWQLVLRNQEPTVREVAVPDGLLYKTEAQARALLDEVNLVATVQSEETTDTTTIGQVLRTEPIAGTPVPEGSEVLLVLNGGPKMATVPSGLLGMQADDAMKLLEVAGLTGRIVEAEDEDQDAVKGSVLRVAPEEGAEVPVNEPVTLTVATGMSRLPSLLGMTADEARQEAADYGFTNLQFEPSDGTVVIRTDPQPQSRVDRTELVTVYLEAPEPSPTPTPEPDPEPTESPDVTNPPLNPDPTAEPIPDPTPTP